MQTPQTGPLRLNKLGSGHTHMHTTHGTPRERWLAGWLALYRAADWDRVAVAINSWCSGVYEQGARSPGPSI